MKVVIEVGTIVIDMKNLTALEKFVEGAERRDYDYANGYIHYIKPLEADGMRITAITEDKYQAEKLVWKLKEEEARSKGGSS